MNAPARDRSAPGVRLSVAPTERGPTGERIDFDGRIISFSISDGEKKADLVQIVLDNFDLSLFDCAPLMSGALLEVTWGYPGNMAPPRRVVVQKIKGFQQLTIEAHATSMLMAKETKTRSWQGKKRSDVVVEIAREHGYVGDFVKVDDTKIVIDTISQHGESDAAFLRRVANLEGYQFFVDDTGFHFHERDQSTPPTHVMTWYASGDCDVLEVSVDGDLSRRTGSVTVSGRDPLEKKTITPEANVGSTARDKLAGQPTVIKRIDAKTGATSYARAPAPPQASRDPEATAASSGGALGALAGLFGGGSAAADARTSASTQAPTSAGTTEQAKRQADAKFKKAERESIKIALKVVGDPTLRAKQVIELRGVSGFLSGKYYVTEAKHSVSGSGYVTELKLTRDGRGGAGSGAGSVSGAGTTSDKGNLNRAQKGAPGAKEPIKTIDPKTGAAKLSWKGGQGSSDPEGKR